MVSVQRQLYHGLLPGVSNQIPQIPLFFSPPSSFSQPIPNGIAVPHYAYLDVEVSWNARMLTNIMTDTIFRPMTALM